MFNLKFTHICNKSNIGCGRVKNYLVFVLVSWHEASKTLGIYSLLYANHVAGEGARALWPGHQKSQLGQHFEPAAIPSPGPWKGSPGNGRWGNLGPRGNLASLGDGASLKPLKWQVPGTTRLAITFRCSEGACPERARKLWTPPHTLPLHLFPVLFLSFILYSE